MTAIKREAEKFAGSSMYRYGDAGSFRVPISPGVELPGSESPLLYMDRIGCSAVSGRILVIAPANGGLVSACFARGATEVVAIEYRTRFHGVIDTVLQLVAKGRSVDGKTTNWRVLSGLPGGDDWSEQLGQFDLVVWAEGVDEISEPKRIFKGVASCVAPGGKLIAEVYHGSNNWVDRINSWRPTGDAMLEAAQECFGACWTHKLPARRGNGMIYNLTKKAKAAEVAPKKVEPKKETPEVAPKKVEPTPAPKKVSEVKKEKVVERPKKTPEAPVAKKQEEIVPPPAAQPMASEPKKTKLGDSSEEKSSS